MVGGHSEQGDVGHSDGDVISEGKPTMARMTPFCVIKPWYHATV